MKKIYLSFIFAAALGFIGWQWSQHWVPAAQATTGCAINITKFNPNVYNSDVLDYILFDNGFIDNRGDFFNAVKTGALPFTTNKASEEKINLVMAAITKDVCKGNCSSDSLVMQSSCSAGCAINITKFDLRVYNPRQADDILFNYNFIANSGDFANAVKTGKLPFLTKTLSEPEATDAVFAIKQTLCGKPDKCDQAALVLDLQCTKPDNSSASPFEQARTARVERLATMNTCQKQVFQTMQTNNEQYLKVVQKNNQQYYSAMAPITAKFRQGYFAEKDPAQRQSMLGDYINQNQTKRATLYQSQAKALSSFLSLSSNLNSQFNACTK